VSTAVHEGLAIHKLLGTPSMAGVDSFLAGHKFPLVEGASCTFVYRGAAQAVHLKHWVFGLPSSQSFHRVKGTDLWYLVLQLPERSRVEYKLEVVQGGDGRWIEDPLNPFHARDPFGSNSVVHGAGYEEPEWIRPQPTARPGSLREMMFQSEALGGSRRVTLYLPARFRTTRKYPLVVVHDGSDYLRYSSLQTVLDNLIHRLDIPEIVVALTDPDERLEEYAADPRHARYLVEELVPQLERELPLDSRPESRCLMGASFGAVACLAAARQYPDFFGRLLLQSGSFAFTDIGPSARGPVFEPVVEFMNEFRRRPERVAERVFVSCGTYESLIYENRSLVPLLQSTGMEVRYVEARDGHNWENWRDRLREGLSWLFPGPLRMVYE
jgi:enterochelin esterase-like enzyme